MHITGKRIVRVDKYTRGLNLAKPLFVYHAAKKVGPSFRRVGLSASAKIGDTILPLINGKVSEFNADGAWRTRDDLPKESRVVGQRIWRWKEFRGRYDHVDKERTVDVTRMCYPREFIPPPSLEMSVAIVDGKLRLVTPLPANAAKDLVKHAVNLYLEAFGECHLTDKPDEVPLVTPKKVNWKLLPQGANPWKRAQSAVTARLPSSADQQEIIVERQKYICEFDPDEVYAGEGGFSDYLAYVFPSKGLSVLESVTTGNAIYVFDRNWRNISQMSKRDILAGGLEKDRIIHATGWHKRLAEHLE